MNHVISCSFAGCGNPRKGKSDYCSAHCQRIVRGKRDGHIPADAPAEQVAEYLRSLPPLRTSPFPPGTECVVAGCEEPDIKGMCKGAGPYCQWHHGRALRGESLEPRKVRPDFCSAEFDGEACGRGFFNNSGKGLLPAGVPLCKTHYDQNKGGLPLTKIQERRPALNEVNWTPLPIAEVRAINRGLPEGMRFCNKCGETKSLEFFYERTNGNPQSWCIDCQKRSDRIRLDEPDAKKRNRKRVKEWSKNNPDRVRARNLRKFNLGEDPVRVYEEILAAQGGGCAICGAKPGSRKLDVDHDHSCCDRNGSCGECVRGLLCINCNHGIGKFLDDPEILLKAAGYLLKWKGQS